MIFYLLFIICYFLVSWLRPKWALFLLLVLLPTYQLRFQAFGLPAQAGLPTTFLEVMIVALFIARLPRITNLNELRIKLKKWKLPVNRSLSAGGEIVPTKVGIPTGVGRVWRLLILAWLVIGLISVFVSPDFIGALGHWRAYFLEPILLLLVLVDFATCDPKTSILRRGSATEDRRIHASRQLADPPTGGNDTNITSISPASSSTFNTVLLALSVSALICSIWAIWQKITGQGMASLETWQYPLKLTMRPTGLFPQSNFLGLFLGPLILLFFGKFVELFKNKKLLLSIYYLLVSIASILAIIFAKSEGAILGVLMGLVFFFIFYLKKRLRIIFIAILLLAICFLLFLSPWQKTIWQKITFQDLSLKIRLNIWQGAWQMIETHPFFGVGLRGYQQLVNQYQEPFILPDVAGVISDELHPYPHNLFLTLWAELGIFGLLIFILIVIRFFVLGFKNLFRISNFEFRISGLMENNKVLIIVILSSMIVILTHGLVDTSYFKNDLAVLFWLIVGLLMIIENNKEQKVI